MHQARSLTARALHQTGLLLTLASIGGHAQAQQPPNAGGQLLQIAPAPLQPMASPQIRLQEQRAAPATANDVRVAEVRIVVQVLRITGATAFSEAELLTLAGFRPGEELTLAQLQSMADAITQHYRRNGFLVAQAFLAAQDVKDNVVTMTVSEGRYGSVTVNNSAQLSGRVAQRALEGLNTGDPITTGPLDSALLLLADTPGINVKSTLSPGSAPGTSDLTVDITPGARVSGSVDVDNGGSRYTGRYRVGATGYLNNPFGLGDIASLRLVTSGSGLNYARISYQAPVGKAQVGVAYSWLDYELGKEFAALQAHGTARVASVYGRYPLIRSRDDNLYVQLGLDAKTFHDAVDSTGSITDKRSHVVLASLYGDRRDSWGGGGQNNYSLTLSSGNLDIETPAARAADALTARTNGRFNKLAFSASRLQALGGPWSLYGAIGGQVASKNLDSSEKIVLGGMGGVRAYPEGETYADEGVIVTLEARLDLAKPETLPGQVQLVAFVDGGTVTINQDPWVAGPNHRTLSAAGVGINWGETGNFLVRAYYAHRLGSEPAISAPSGSGRVWVQLVKFF